MRMPLFDCFSGKVLPILVNYLVLGLMLIGSACSKSEDALTPENNIIVSETGNKELPINKFQLSVDGQKDTIYVFSSSQVTAKVSDATSWVKIINTEYKADSKSYMIVLQADPMDEDFSVRKGELDISNEQQYARNFLQLTQGYKIWLNEDFSWLHNGHGNPLKMEEGVLIKGWDPAQIAHLWTSEVLPGETSAYVYGKDGYVQIGSETSGANLLTPKLTGLQNDSIMLLSFSATAFINGEGIKDAHKLTIVLDGGQFADGKETKTIDLGYYDYTSALIATTMWDNAFYSFTINKKPSTPNSTTIQVKFIDGEGIPQPGNRVFLDNVRIFSVATYAPIETN